MRLSAVILPWQRWGEARSTWERADDFGLYAAYTYDHLYALIGNEKIHWSTVIAKLDNIVPASGPEIERYFSIHRLAAT